MSAPTIAEVRATHSQLVYDKLTENFDATKWATITPITVDEECDITYMKAAVFSFDRDAWATACATATGCTFDKTLYVPYAFGFLWKEGGVTPCSSSSDGPYIMAKPGSTLPFEGLYWNHNPNLAAVYTGVTYDASTYKFYDTASTRCNDLNFLDGCFADLRAPGNAYSLTFSLLKSTEGLADGSE